MNTKYYSQRVLLISSSPTHELYSIKIKESASVYYTERKPKNKKRGRPGNEATPSSLSPTFMYYTKIKETWDMANFCFSLLYFDAVQFMCRRTGYEKHPLRIIFGVHSFCSCFITMESQLHTTSDSSRLEFLYYLATEHQNSSVDYAL